MKRALLEEFRQAAYNYLGRWQALYASQVAAKTSNSWLLGE